MLQAHDAFSFVKLSGGEGILVASAEAIPVAQDAQPVAQANWVTNATLLWNYRQYVLRASQACRLY